MKIHTDSAPGLMPNLRRLIAMMILISTLAGGCVMHAGKARSETASTPLTHALPTPTSLISPTPVIVEQSIDTAPPTSLPPLPTPLPEPLRFTFPTSAPALISGWRPPLYPVPWEPTPQDHFYFSRPIGANEINWPLAKYRYGGVFFQDTVHSGVDIPAPKGTPVLAAGPGEVVWGGYGLFYQREELNDPYGLAIAIKHDFGYQGQPIYTVYGHMDEIYAFRGQHVETGQVIGIVGETGQVTGPHLHFEVRLNENKGYGSRNPELWMAPPQGWGVLAGRVMGSEGDLIYKRTVNLRNIETNQFWYVITYGKGSVNPDDYYKENMVIGDLPAGTYRVWIEYSDTIYDALIDIIAGRVSFFEFWGQYGVEVGPPPTPAPDFVRPDATATPTEEN